LKDSDQRRKKLTFGSGGFKKYFKKTSYALEIMDLKGTLARKIWLQIRQPEHQLHLKDEPPTFLKII
jgi:hypothetical protein